MTSFVLDYFYVVYYKLYHKLNKLRLSLFTESTHSLGGAMRPSWALLAVCVVLSGCAGVQGYPKYFSDYNTKFIDHLYFDIFQENPRGSYLAGKGDPKNTLFARFQRCLSNTCKNDDGSIMSQKDCRNLIVGELMLFIETQYNQFRADLYRQTVLTGIGGNLATVGLSTASALAGIGGASKAVQSSMSALTAGIVGAQAGYDKEVLFSQTMPAIIAFMDGDRQAKSSEIYKKFSTSYDAYPLPMALAEVNAFFLAGTLPGAINALTQAAVAKSAQTEADKKTALDAKKTALQQQAQISLKDNQGYQENVLKRLVVILGSVATEQQKSDLSTYGLDMAKTVDYNNVSNKLGAILYCITMIQDESTYNKVNIVVNTPYMPIS